MRRRDHLDVRFHFVRFVILFFRSGIPRTRLRDRLWEKYLTFRTSAVRNRETWTDGMRLSQLPERGPGTSGRSLSEGLVSGICLLQLGSCLCHASPFVSTYVHSWTGAHVALSASVVNVAI